MAEGMSADPASTSERKPRRRHALASNRLPIDILPWIFAATVLRNDCNDAWLGLPPLAVTKLLNACCKSASPEDVLESGLPPNKLLMPLLPSSCAIRFWILVCN